MSEAPPRSPGLTRSNEAPFGLLPEVMSDEMGETWYAVGHVDRARFVLALMLTTADDEGPAAAFLNVVGWAKPGQARRIAAEEFLASIKHVWLRERPDINDEAMEFCLPGDDGAQAFTQVDVHV